MKTTRIAASIALGALSVALCGVPVLADDGTREGVSANRDWSVAGTLVTSDREYSVNTREG